MYVKETRRERGQERELTRRKKSKSYFLITAGEKHKTIAETEKEQVLHLLVCVANCLTNLCEW